MTTTSGENRDSQSAAALLAAARTGSRDALGLLMQSFRTYLLVVGTRELRPDLRVKISPSDLVQETFAEGQLAIGRFVGDTPAEFQAWLRGILLNKLANARRRYMTASSRDLSREEPQKDKSSMFAQVEPLIDDETPCKLAAKQEEAHQIRAALARLPDHYRQVIQLRNFDLLPFAEIATVMRRSEHELRALWVRAVKRLKWEYNGLDTD